MTIPSENTELLEHSHFWWEYKMVQSLWKRYGQFPIKLNINLPLRPSNSIPMYLPKRNENICPFIGIAEKPKL